MTSLFIGENLVVSYSAPTEDRPLAVSWQIGGCLPGVYYKKLPQVYTFWSLQKTSTKFRVTRQDLITVHAKAWNKAAGTRGNLHFKFAPGSQEFGMNQGPLAIYSSMVPDHKKVRTQRGLFSLVLWKQVMIISPEEKFTANVRIFVLYYIFVTYCQGRILTAYCCAR